MKKNIATWMQRILESHDRLAMPVMTYPGLELVGMNVNDIVRDGDKQFACIESLGKRYSSVAVLTLMDLSVEAEAFGCSLRFDDDEVPCVTSPVLLDAQGVGELNIPPLTAGRLPVYIHAAARAAAHYPDRLGLGGMIGPFTLAGRLRDLTAMLMDTMDEPELLHCLLDKCTRFLIDYARAFKAAGADGIMIAEPAAGLIAPEQCDEFSSTYVRRIVDAVQSEHFAVLLHNCGNTLPLIPSMLSTGATGYHFGNTVDLAKILELVPRDVLVFGNIDPACILRHGKPSDVLSATQMLLEQTVSYPNFVLSSGCDIPPGTPLENIDAFYAALRQFNASIQLA